MSKSLQELASLSLDERNKITKTLLGCTDIPHGNAIIVLETLYLGFIRGIEGTPPRTLVSFIKTQIPKHASVVYTALLAPIYADNADGRGSMELIIAVSEAYKVHHRTELLRQIANAKTQISEVRAKYLEKLIENSEVNMQCLRSIVDNWPADFNGKSMSYCKLMLALLTKVPANTALGEHLTKVQAIVDRMEHWLKPRITSLLVKFLK